MDSSTSPFRPRRTIRRLVADPRWFPRLARFYPPLLGAGIRILSIDPGWTRGVIELSVRPWNANFHGAAFGGALFSATDVLFGTMLAHQLGSHFEVWTKSATIDFLRPGSDRLRLEVSVPAEEARHIAEEVREQGQLDVPHVARMTNRAGEVVAEARHTMRVRLRRG